MDEDKQKAIEKSVSVEIQQRYKQNISAFNHYIPTIPQLIASHTSQRFSIFGTLAEQINMVDFSTGRTWYGTTPKQEMRDEVRSFLAAAPYLDFHSNALNDHWPTEPLQHQAEAIVMFGLGLGYQLEYLLEQLELKYLVVYEPSLDVVQCSLQAVDWLRILQVAEKSGTQLFLQFDNDGSTLPEDLAELIPLLSGDKVYIYRHYFHPVMDEVMHFAFGHSAQPDHLTNKYQVFLPDTALFNNLPEHNHSNLGNFASSDYTNPSLLEKNLAALEEYYPHVFKEISSYKAINWRLVKDDRDQTNLLHCRRNALFYDDAKQESEFLVDAFEKNPFRDDVILGQKVTKKLSHYIHFTAVEKAQPVIRNIMTGSSALPDDIESMIIFGIGLGLHIEQLCDSHSITNLYVCEPNLDFFLASLHVIDWSDIIQKADISNRRIYFNLGGDGSNYFYDLMAQFYQVGAYSIANTYLLSSYFDPDMQKSISNLRSELRVVLALGEYYDHARYGISHTYNSLKQHHKFLKFHADDYSRASLLTKPVFIIGNGPSLDDAIEYIQLYRQQVILISCGTALKSLHSRGIKPDFHAEIEQNKSTFYWISQVNDPEYLKSIRLISVNGIHPDTAALFKDVLLCFKSGESSTLLFQSTIEKGGYKIMPLSYAYPTVSNLVVNFVLQAGFRYLYLFGVDLGYADLNYHHSKLSSYYKSDGTELYNYKETHGGGMPVKGNFLPYVFTKPEFDVSRKLIEQAIAKTSNKIEVYNCSNGVAIDGAVPLRYESILLGTDFVRDTEIEDFIANAFFADLSPFADSVFSSIDTLSLSESVFEWLAFFEQPIESLEDARRFVEEQWRFLRSKIPDRKNLIFYLFYGSANYFSGVLTKILASASSDEAECLQAFKTICTIWQESILQGHDSFLEQPLKFDDVDVSHYFQ
ncbi:MULTISPECIES: 6-hydroxymethylpterin diphosphokinase MptE-like protein [Alkalimonas]|uniref:DUF115 domain-containing protein n=2 Tax=Alkalimonas TaxID=265980 RepID=A0ABU7J449_9GAMM|nr:MULTISPECIES: 6-hydroxymethylpterin diphosphokinase MptE-like protein [unclassified Alkalimonas]MEE2001197.1 DUF115 domain-containing protein [Alkalimonas sp. MEB108]MEE2025822.1 DUF115 domain-containing protein [Alkalimonas sp. MEB004]